MKIIEINFDVLINSYVEIYKYNSPYVCNIYKVLCPSNQMRVNSKTIQFYNNQACMNKTKTIRKQRKSQQTSSGNNLFKLIPTSKNTNPKISIKEIDFGDFVDEFREQVGQKIGNNIPLTSPENSLNLLFGSEDDQSLLNNTGCLNPEVQRQGSQQIDHPNDLQKDGQIYVAFPGTNRCQICKQSFENYFQHIGNLVHKNKQKTYLVTNQKNKVSLDQAISNLINSLNKVESKSLKNSTQKREKEREGLKRQRSNDNVDSVLFCPSPQKKMRYAEDVTPNLVNSLQSTSLINSNCLL